MSLINRWQSWIDEVASGPLAITSAGRPKCGPVEPVEIADDMFGDQIGFEVHGRWGLFVPESGCRQRMRNQGDAKLLLGHCHHREAHAVDGDRSFWHKKPVEYGRACEPEDLPFV